MRGRLLVPADRGRVNLTNCCVELFERSMAGTIRACSAIGRTMDTILLLIAVNFLVVPFLQEAEAQGCQLRHFPGLLRILRLSHVRRSNWLRSFCIFALFLLAIAVFRAQGGHVDSLILAIYFALMQIVLWSVVFLSVRKHARAPFHAGTQADEAPGRPVAALLPRRT